jgi:hypothetical protein
MKKLPALPPPGNIHAPAPVMGLSQKFQGFPGSKSGKTGID